MPSQITADYDAAGFQRFDPNDPATKRLVSDFVSRTLTDADDGTTFTAADPQTATLDTNLAVGFKCVFVGDVTVEVDEDLDAEVLDNRAEVPGGAVFTLNSLGGGKYELWGTKTAAPEVP